MVLSENWNNLFYASSLVSGGLLEIFDIPWLIQFCLHDLLVFSQVHLCPNFFFYKNTSLIGLGHIPQHNLIFNCIISC